MLIRLCFFLLCICFACNNNKHNTIFLSDKDWNLWLDTLAEWRSDRIYMSDAVDWANIPVMEPSEGWNVVRDQEKTFTISLPTMVEDVVCESYLKDLCQRKEYYDPSTQSYFVQHFYSGVCWLSQSFQVPASVEGKEMRLSLQAIGLRTEVYLNQQLVGYQCGGGVLPMQIDVASALHYGHDNILSVRITSDVLPEEAYKTGVIRWGDTDQLLMIAAGGAGLAAGVYIDPIEK